MNDVPKRSDEVDANTEYQQASETIRHYSSLRYAILTVYVAINAAIISAAYVNSATETSAFIGLWLRIFGVAAALSFLFIELTLDRYLSGIGKKIEESWPSSHWCERPKLSRKLIPYATAGIYLVLLLFWISSFVDFLK